MYIMILVTAKDKREAKKIVKILLEKKLIACANIIKGIESFFWWDKKVDQSRESLIVIKTKKSLLKKVEKEVKKAHSYDVPEIIAFPILGGNADYLKWIKQSVC